MSLADDYVAAMAPWMTPDLETYLRAVASMFEEVEELSGDSDDFEGWEILLDPDRCPARALPYLAQYVGEVLPEGIPEALAREWIKDAPNQRRGTTRSIFLAAQRKLTGSRTVSMRERYSDTGTTNVDWLTVITYTLETPDPEGTEADIRSVLPHDVILNYEVLEGQTWDDVDAAFASWTDADTAYDTWAEMAHDIVGLTSFSRPMPELP